MDTTAIALLYIIIMYVINIYIYIYYKCYYVIMYGYYIAIHVINILLLLHITRVIIYYLLSYGIISSLLLSLVYITSIAALL